MSDILFGEAQRRAKRVGLVMSRRNGAIDLRFRDPSLGNQTWSGLTHDAALEIIYGLSEESRQSGSLYSPPASSLGDVSAHASMRRG